jgi:hypothetical protein
MATWSEAFAEQARSDLNAYNFLAGTSLPTSHRLHYLQMWLEKLCKAYLWMPGVGNDNLRTTHNVIDKVLPVLISKYWRRIGFEQPPDMTQIRKLCREVDLLHPQVDDENRRPDNVEYPWTGSSGAVEVPAKWKFALAGLNSNPGRILLKAAIRLTRDPLFIR